jgi:hypothetical protein
MTDTTTNNYEELIVGVLINNYEAPANFTVGLYNDSVDAIGPGDDIGAITSEPTGSSYSRQSVDRVNCSSSQSGGNQRLEFPRVDFDTSDSDEGIDSYFLMAEFNDGTNSTYRLISTGKIESDTYSVDLSNIDQYTLSNIFIEHSES